MATRIDKNTLLQAFEIARPRLEADPIFRHSANALFDANELRGYLAAAPETFEELFSDTLQGMIQSVRYAALQVVAEVFRNSKERVELEHLEIGEGETRFHGGDLAVRANVENEGILVVAGNLTIGHSYVGAVLDYSLLAVGRTLAVQHVKTMGEVLIGERLDASGLVYFHYNDYSCVIPHLRARALVQEDHHDAIGTLEVEEHQQRGAPDEQLLIRLFGEPARSLGSQELHKPLRKLMTGRA